jgi:anti-sigma regulatory factor (Ser/Thr protein kinase)
MPRTDLHALTQWVTEAAVLHGDHLHDALMAHQGASRRRAGALLRRLAMLQWLEQVDTGGRGARYRPGALRQVVKRYEVAGLHEDLPWRRDFAPYFSVREEVRRMAQYAFTELLNNAIDHSGGTSVTVSMRQTPLQLQLLVSDDGCGLFQRIGESFEIADPRLALLELSKGKLTSRPSHHCGHGLFFTAQLSDVLDIHANEAGFQRRAWDRMAWHEARPAARGGTSVYLAIALDTPRTLEEVLRAHSVGDNPFAFERTVVPLHVIGNQRVLTSRADAKRAVSRLSQFCRAEMDFAGITDVGHGFVDEMFRVFRRDNPGVELIPVGMSANVAAMVHSVSA